MYEDPEGGAALVAATATKAKTIERWLAYTAAGMAVSDEMKGKLNLLCMYLLCFIFPRPPFPQLSTVLR